MAVVCLDFVTIHDVCEAKALAQSCLWASHGIKYDQVYKVVQKWRSYIHGVWSLFITVFDVPAALLHHLSSTQLYMQRLFVEGPWT